MARYTAVQIYAYARAAGFDPDQAVTMTAIALAESGGRDTAHATRGEDSRGLWQINAAAHPEFDADSLWNPAANAAAAFLVSRHGADVSPWTTTHGGTRAAYVRFRAEAQAAAAAHGEPTAQGVWTGTSGYGHTLAAGSGQGASTAWSDAGPNASTPSHAAGSGQGASTASPDAGPNASTPSHAATDAAATDAAATDALAYLGGVPMPPDPMLAPVSTPLEPGERHGLAFVEAPASDPTASTHTTGTAATTTALGATASADPATATPATATPATATPATATPVTVAAAPTAHPGTTTRLDVFVAEALAQRGDRYVMGATARTDDPNPSAFDCSELVHWAAARAGISVPDGALPQYLDLQRRGLMIPVDQAIHIRGALLFRFASPPDAHNMRPAASHVAISLGDGHTIEARGRAYGVNEFDATTSRFQYAAMLPHAGDHVSTALAGDNAHLLASPSSAATEADVRPVETGGDLLDTDGEGLPDRLEYRLGLDPYRADTDHDGLSDSYELVFGHSAPLSAAPSDLSWGRAADSALLQPAVQAAEPADAGPAEAAAYAPTALVPESADVTAAQGGHSTHPGVDDATHHPTPDLGDPRTGGSGGGLGAVEAEVLHFAGGVVHGISHDLGGLLADLFGDGSGGGHGHAQ